MPLDQDLPWLNDVYYRGFRGGKGIWETWEIGTFTHGGFHIWRKGERADETMTGAKEVAARVEAKGKVQEAGVAVPAKDGPTTSSYRDRLK